MKILKTYVHNGLGEKNLQGLAMEHIRKDIVIVIDTDKAIKHFAIGV